jgi:hypothetical protein
MQFNYLAIVNVDSVSVHPDNSKTPVWVKCHAVSIAWGDWYKQRPFNGSRDIRLLWYGGMDVAALRIGPDETIYVDETKLQNYKFSTGSKVVFTENFKPDPQTCELQLFTERYTIKVHKCDSKQPFKLVNYVGDTAPFGETVEEWISPYITFPNRPFLTWGPNPERKSEPFLTYHE